MAKDEFLLAPEDYENSQTDRDITFLISQLKNQLKEEFQDELIRLQYVLSKKEQELVIRENQLAIREAELTRREQYIIQREQRLEKEQIERFAAEKPLADLTEAEQKELDTLREEKRISKSKIHNPEGKGGLGSNSEATVISSGIYQGDRIRIEDDIFLDWDKDNKEYKFSSPTAGLKFTFFAAEMAYPNKGYICHDNQVYSQNKLKKQVWYAQTPKNRHEDGLGPQYNGRVPLQVLKLELNSRINAAQVLDNGNIIENIDFTRAFANWRYRYEYGTYYKTKEGELYRVLEHSETKSQGNPPQFRTDGNMKSKTYGQQKRTTRQERLNWLKSKV